MDGNLIHNKFAKKIIYNLIDAARLGSLAEMQDGGVHCDIVFSRIKGQEHKVITVSEAERILDKAIIAAYQAMTGLNVEGDPVEFIDQEN